MPSGYTYQILEDPEFTFDKYVIKCIGAFDVSCRDGAKLQRKTEIQDDDYYIKRLISSEQELEHLEKMPEAEIIKRYQKHYDGQLKEQKEDIASYKKESKKYNEYLDKAKAWMAPTVTHGRFKRFLIEQIEASMYYKTMEDFLESHHVPEKQDPFEWHNQGKEYLKESISRSKLQIDKDKDRISERNEWVEAIFQSVKLCDECDGSGVIDDGGGATDCESCKGDGV